MESIGILSSMGALSFLSKDLYAIVFDIGSATIGVAIAKYSKAKSIEILFTHREFIQYGNEQSADALGEYVAETIEKAGAKALENLGKSGRLNASYTVHALIHAPWVHSQTQYAEGNLQTEVPVTKELLQQFMAKKMPLTHTDGRVQLDRHVTQITLNGYPTTKPYDKSAKNIAITALESDISDSIHRSIVESFSNVFPNHTVNLDSFLFATTQLSEFFEEFDTYTIIDIGGEYTSIHVIRDNIVSASTWASFGTEYLVRALTKEDESNRQSAVSELAIYIENTCTPSQCRKVETSLAGVEQVWVRAFGDACAKLSKQSRIPTKVFIFIDKRYGKWFKDVIEKIDFGHFTVTGNPLEAQFLSLDRAKRPIKYNESTKQDVILALEILFVDK